jgi:heme-degrading monooxygenase HmoA
MIGRVSTIQIKKGKEGEAVEILKEVVHNTVSKKVKGYRGVQFLADPNTGKGYAISYWDSEEDAIANEQSGYDQAQIDKFNEVFAVPLELIGRYDVVYLHWND